MSSEKRKEIERIYLGLEQKISNDSMDYETFVQNVKKHTDYFNDYIYEMLKWSASVDLNEPSYSFSLKKYRNDDLIKIHKAPIPKTSEEGYFLLKNIYVFKTTLKDEKNPELVNLLKKTGADTILIDIDQIYDYCDKNNFCLGLIEKNYDSDSICKYANCDFKVNVPILERGYPVQRKRK